MKVGLTGSIGMGKSTTAAMFAELGVPVYDADAAVHGLYAPGGKAVNLIESVFPNTTSAARGVDRKALRSRVKDDPAAFVRLESLVHPMVARERRTFVRRMRRAREPLVVLDVPLLFETGF